jgi:hypothetical protein
VVVEIHDGRLTLVADTKITWKDARVTLGGGSIGGYHRAEGPRPECPCEERGVPSLTPSGWPAGNNRAKSSAKGFEQLGRLVRAPAPLV